MSTWTHVAGVVRIDMLRFPQKGESDEKEIIKEMTNYFGKELNYDDMWNEDDIYEHPEHYLPFGSEGSLKMSVWVNPDFHSIAAVTVSIFGDLRDYSDVNGIVEWFKKKCNSDIAVRNACITAQNDCNELVIWYM